MQPTTFDFHHREDEIGQLVFLEECKDVPFEVKRVYYIYGVKDGARRGFHAHKSLEQACICIHGSCKVMLDDGKERIDVVLDDPTKGLYVGNAVWREMYDFSEDAVFLVLASEYFDEQDYIRDYDQFLAYLKEKEA